MDRDVVRRLVYSMVGFLRSQLECSETSPDSLSEEGVESVEVALQCLETAYGISAENTELIVPRSLYDIFSECVRDMPKVETRPAVSQAPPKEATDEEKAQAEVLKNQGNQLMREDKFVEALESYTKAINKDSLNAVYYCNRAAAHSKLNNHVEAIQDCRRALDIENQYSKAYGRMGLAYSSLEDHHRAKDCYKKALEIEPDNESYRGNLAIAEEKIASAPAQPPPNPFAAFGNLGGFGNLAGLGGGGPDLGSMFNNPALMNMASQLMSDPNMQNLFMGSMGNVGGMGGVLPPAAAPPGAQTTPGAPQGMEALLSAGRQLAEQMQAQHPDLVEQIRQQINRGPSDGSAGPGTQDAPPQS